MFSSAVSLAAAVRCFGCRTPGRWLCRGCRELLGPPKDVGAIPGVDRAHIAWHYEGAARDLVLALKLRSARPAAAVMAKAVAQAIQASGTAAEVMTWVPGRPRDIRVRGFDHAGAIARELGALTGIPLVPLLERTRDRPDQTTLSGQARWSNLDGAFAATGSAGRVLVVDDLVTTGATASSCATALRRLGASVVEVAAPCRA